MTKSIGFKALFRKKLGLAGVALSFIFGNYYPTID